MCVYVYGWVGGWIDENLSLPIKFHISYLCLGTNHLLTYLNFVEVISSLLCVPISEHGKYNNQTIKPPWRNKSSSLGFSMTVV